MSDSNQTQLRYVPEATYGTTPADDNGWKPLPFNSETLSAGPTTVESQRIRGTDRMPSDLKKVNTEVGGGITSELSAFDYDDFLQAGMMANYSEKVDMAASTIAVTAATGTFADSGNGFVTAGIEVGDVITTAGFTNGGNNGTFTVATVAAGSLTVTDNTGLADEAEGQSVTINTGSNRLTAGLVYTVNQFTVEKQFADLTSKFIQFQGVRVGQLTFGFIINQMVDFGMTLAGANGQYAASSLVGSGSVAAASGQEVLAGNVDTDFVEYDGTLISSSGIVITRIDLTIDNTLRANYSLDSQTPINQKAGTHRFSGTIEAYVADESWAIYQAMLDNTATSLRWKVTGADGKGYIFTLPKIKLSGQAPGSTGLDTDNMVRADFLNVQTAPSIDRIP